MQIVLLFVQVQENYPHSVFHFRLDFPVSLSPRPFHFTAIAMSPGGCPLRKSTAGAIVRVGICVRIAFEFRQAANSSLTLIVRVRKRPLRARHPRADGSMVRIHGAALPIQIDRGRRQFPTGLKLLIPARGLHCDYARERGSLLISSNEQC